MGRPPKNPLQNRATRSIYVDKGRYATIARIAKLRGLSISEFHDEIYESAIRKYAGVETLTSSMREVTVDLGIIEDRQKELVAERNAKETLFASLEQERDGAEAEIRTDRMLRIEEIQQMLDRRVETRKFFARYCSVRFPLSGPRPSVKLVDQANTYFERKGFSYREKYEAIGMAWTSREEIEPLEKELASLLEEETVVDAPIITED
jgi:predicted DNA-binding ribbon-helix-helix protein